MKYKIALLFSLCALLSFAGISQKVMTDGTITFDVSVVSGKDQPGISDAFDGASYTVQLKGTQARTDLKSNLRVQTIFFNAKENAAVMLKESGKEKYMISLNPQQWEQYNSKTNGINFKYTDETKTVAGYNCKKAVGTLKNGSKIEVYYTPDIKPLAAGYEDAFTNLPGLPLEYEITTGGIVVRYKATSIQNSPVAASRFDLPKAGYKILEYRQ